MLMYQEVRVSGGEGEGARGHTLTSATVTRVLQQCCSVQCTPGNTGQMCPARLQLSCSPTISLYSPSSKPCHTSYLPSEIHSVMTAAQPQPNTTCMSDLTLFPTPVITTQHPPTPLNPQGLRRKGSGAAGPPVGQPLMKVLTTNYRTHAGILDAAASITSVLSNCFPHLLDKLPRERAFFPGPQPLLLGSLDSMDDLSILLSSDPGGIQGEGGQDVVKGGGGMVKDEYGGGGMVKDEYGARGGGVWRDVERAAVDTDFLSGPVTAETAVHLYSAAR